MRAFTPFNFATQVNTGRFSRGSNSAIGQIRQSGQGIANLFNQLGNEQANERSQVANDFINSIDTEEAFKAASDSGALSASALSSGGRVNPDVIANAGNRLNQIRTNFISDQNLKDARDNAAERPIIQNLNNQFAEASGTGDFSSFIESARNSGLRDNSSFLTRGFQGRDQVIAKNKILADKKRSNNVSNLISGIASNSSGQRRSADNQLEALRQSRSEFINGRNVNRDQQGQIVPGRDGRPTLSNNRSDQEIRSRQFFDNQSNNISDELNNFNINDPVEQTDISFFQGGDVLQGELNKRRRELIKSVEDNPDLSFNEDGTVNNDSATNPPDGILTQEQLSTIDAENQFNNSFFNDSLNQFDSTLSQLNASNAPGSNIERSLASLRQNTDFINSTPDQQLQFENQLTSRLNNPDSSTEFQRNINSQISRQDLSNANNRVASAQSIVQSLQTPDTPLAIRQDRITAIDDAVSSISNPEDGVNFSFFNEGLAGQALRNFLNKPKNQSVEIADVNGDVSKVPINSDVLKSVVLSAKIDPSFWQDQGVDEDKFTQELQRQMKISVDFESRARRELNNAQLNLNQVRSANAIRDTGSFVGSFN